MRALQALVLASCATTTPVVELDVPAAPQTTGAGSISYTQPAPFRGGEGVLCGCDRADLECEVDGRLLRLDWSYAAGEFPAELEPTTCQVGDRDVDVRFTRYAPVPLPWIDRHGRVVICRQSPAGSLAVLVPDARAAVDARVPTPGIRCHGVEGGVRVVVWPHPPVQVSPGTHWCSLEEEPERGVELVLVDLDP